MRAWAIALVIGIGGAGAAYGEDAIRAVYVRDGVPMLPEEPAWENATPFEVNLLPQMMLPPQGGGAVAALTVRALHDGERLALRLDWSDETEDRAVGVDRFRDAVAVGFPAREAEMLPSPLMGDEAHPINIWQWTADFDANAQGRGAFAENYPHTDGVWYFPQDAAVMREVQGWRGTEPVIELIAAGVGTLERKVSQNVLGLSRYRDGRWSVVLRRQLSTGNPQEPLFRPGAQAHAIFAVWNGSKREVNGKKSVTMMWIPLILDPTFQVEP